MDRSYELFTQLTKKNGRPECSNVRTRNHNISEWTCAMTAFVIHVCPGRKASLFAWFSITMAGDTFLFHPIQTQLEDDTTSMTSVHH